MNFLLLKEIIVQLKRKFRCPKCRKNYGNKDISIANIGPEALDVLLTCQKCETQVFANISFLKASDANSGRTHQGIKVKANSFSYVTENDVLDIKNFLSEFSGSFKTLFKENNK